jgi:hypothetical protein
MNTSRALTVFGLALCMMCVLSVSTVFAQTTGWAPPTNLPPTGNVSPVINSGTVSQIKKSGLGIDLSGTLSSLPVGTGLYIKAGSLFIEYGGSSALTSWVADSAYAISTSGRIKAHGLTSTGELQSDLLMLSGQTGERAVCSENSSGKLKICGVDLGPSVTISATPTTISAPTPVTITWSSTNAVSCTGTNFSTGTGNPVSGTKVVNQSAASVVYIVLCADSAGLLTSKSVSVTYTAPTAVIPTATITATPSTISSGGTTAVAWSSTNASSCVAISPSPSTFSTSNATSGTRSFALTNNLVIPATTTFAVRCTSTTGHTADANVVVTVNAPSTVLPTISWGFNPGSLPAGNQSTVVTWSSTNATSCTGSGGVFNTNGQTSGTQTLTQSATTVYNISCVGPGGTKTGSFTVTSAAPALSLDLSLSSDSVYIDGTSNLIWSSTGATSCSGQGTKLIPQNSSQPTNFNYIPAGTLYNLAVTSTSGTLSVSPTEDTRHRYTVTCLGAGGTSITKSVELKVNNGSYIYSRVISPYFGGASTLVPLEIVWSTPPGYYSSCTGVGFSSGGQTSGSVTGVYSISTAFELDCTNQASAPGITTTLPNLPWGANWTLNWVGSSATGCYVGESGNTHYPATGSVVQPSASDLLTYANKVRCFNSNGNVRLRARAVRTTPEISSFTANRLSPTQVQLSWSVLGAACKVNGGTPYTSASQTITLNLSAGSVATLQCSASGGYKTQALIVP